MRASIIFIVTLSIFQLSNQKEGHKRDDNGYIKASNIECETVESWTRNASCKVRAVNRYKRTFEIYIELVQPMKKLNMHAQLFKRYSGWKPYLINYNLTLCNFIVGSKFNPIFQIFKKLFGKSTNMNHSCPYSEAIIGTDIDANDLQFGNSIFPEGRYKLIFKFFENNFADHVATVIFYVDVLEI